MAKRKKAKWQKKLTWTKIKHIKETTTNGTLKQFKFNREFHNKADLDGGDPCCPECNHIAEILGIA